MGDEVEGGEASVASRTFLHVADEWLTWRTEGDPEGQPTRVLSERTSNSYRSIIKNHLAGWGQEPIASYTSDHVARLMEEVLLGAALSSSYSRAIQGVVFQVFAFAKSRAYIADVPGRALRFRHRAAPGTAAGPRHGARDSGDHRASTPPLGRTGRRVHRAGRRAVALLALGGILAALALASADHAREAAHAAVQAAASEHRQDIRERMQEYLAARSLYRAADDALAVRIAIATESLAGPRDAVDAATARLAAADELPLVLSKRDALASAVGAARAGLAAALEPAGDAQRLRDHYRDTAAGAPALLAASAALSEVDPAPLPLPAGLWDDVAAASAALAAEISPWAATLPSLWVRTSGFTAELDDCEGAVDLSAHYGLPIVGQHWSCGGRDFPRNAGTYVTLTGLHAGLYRVDGTPAVLDANRHTSLDIPRGYDLLFQTCIDGSSRTMAFTALTRLPITLP